MRVLVGDIGGTKTSLALASVGDEIEIGEPRRHASASADSLTSLVRRHLDETGIDCEAAVFAVAGPVLNDRCKTTNLPWELDARALERELGLAEVRLLNDLEAVAWAVPALRPDQLHGLHEGEPPPAGGNACVIAAGTGLGVAGMCWDGQRHHPFATEAGHADFAPRTELEFGLLRHLQRRHSHVSWERVVSGQGIVNTFEFLLDWRGAAAPDWLDQPEPAAAIAQAAARGSCSISVETMELFASLYARVIGDLALAHMAVGGVYLAGGVTLSNRRLLIRDSFVQAVFDKGRMGALLRRMPIRVILDEHVALLGAARFSI
ncbi:MAG TPA: glucokinase [Enhygromyxa sp.]|nr:glucokinase [Enhygromyxa sp.]